MAAKQGKRASSGGKKAKSKAAGSSPVRSKSVANQIVVEMRPRG